uniref:Uncharacterized protein n=1 Tax=Caenorhabditis tropicalis TaxID=1561998 RepID=A0A1I7T8W2_9PELO
MSSSNSSVNQPTEKEPISFYNSLPYKQKRCVETLNEFILKKEISAASILEWIQLGLEDGPFDCETGQQIHELIQDQFAGLLRPYEEDALKRMLCNGQGAAHQDNRILKRLLIVLPNQINYPELEAYQTTITHSTKTAIQLIEKMAVGGHFPVYIDTEKTHFKRRNISKLAVITICDVDHKMILLWRVRGSSYEKISEIRDILRWLGKYRRIATYDQEEDLFDSSQNVYNVQHIFFNEKESLKKQLFFGLIST